MSSVVLVRCCAPSQKEAWHRVDIQADETVHTDVFPRAKFLENHGAMPSPNRGSFIGGGGGGGSSGAADGGGGSLTTFPPPSPGDINAGAVRFVFSEQTNTALGLRSIAAGSPTRWFASLFGTSSFLGRDGGDDNCLARVGASLAVAHFQQRLITSYGLRRGLSVLSEEATSSFGVVFHASTDLDASASMLVVPKQVWSAGFLVWLFSRADDRGIHFTTGPKFEHPVRILPPGAVTSFATSGGDLDELARVLLSVSEAAAFPSAWQEAAQFMDRIPRECKTPTYHPHLTGTPLDLLAIDTAKLGNKERIVPTRFRSVVFGFHLADVHFDDHNEWFADARSLRLLEDWFRAEDTASHVARVCAMLVRALASVLPSDSCAFSVILPRSLGREMGYLVFETAFFPAEEVAARILDRVPSRVVTSSVNVMILDSLPCVFRGTADKETRKISLRSLMHTDPLALLRRNTLSSCFPIAVRPVVRPGVDEGPMAWLIDETTLVSVTSNQVADHVARLRESPLRRAHAVRIYSAHLTDSLARYNLCTFLFALFRACVDEVKNRKKQQPLDQLLVNAMRTDCFLLPECAQILPPEFHESDQSVSFEIRVDKFPLLSDGGTSVNSFFVETNAEAAVKALRGQVPGVAVPRTDTSITVRGPGRPDNDTCHIRRLVGLDIGMTNATSPEDIERARECGLTDDLRFFRNVTARDGDTYLVTPLVFPCFDSRRSFGLEMITAQCHDTSAYDPALLCPPPSTPASSSGRKRRSPLASSAAGSAASTPAVVFHGKRMSESNKAARRNQVAFRDMAHHPFANDGDEETDERIRMQNDLWTHTSTARSVKRVPVLSVEGTRMQLIFRRRRADDNKIVMNVRAGEASDTAKASHLLDVPLEELDATRFGPVFDLLETSPLCTRVDRTPDTPLHCWGWAGDKDPRIPQMFKDAIAQFCRRRQSSLGRC